MIHHRESGRLVTTLGVRNLRHDKHEVAARCRGNLVGCRPGDHSIQWLLACLRSQLERAVPMRENLLQLCELSADERACSPGIGVVKSNLKELPVHETCFQRSGIMPRESSLGRGYQQNFQSGLISGSLHRLVQFRSRGPVHQTSRRIPPTQPKGRLQRICRTQNGCRVKHQKSADQESSHPYGDSIPYRSQLKSGSRRDAPLRAQRGSVLIEAIVALTLLSVASLVVLKGTMNILAPRQWTMVQNVSDAYLTFEKAYAQRIPFEELTNSSSPWPVYPARSEAAVTLGTLPGGRTLSGNVIRTRIPDENNLPSHGGSGTASTNPAEMQTWRLQSHVTYTISGREYVKSRTIVRTQ